MQPEWIPEGVDIDTPSVARIYDYLLGGYHNFAVDRTVAHQFIEAIPDISLQAAANRAFLHRAVRFLVDAGVDQFLDLGSGIPTLGNVHEIAQETAPHARVVYVDIDPVAVAHSRHLLRGEEGATAILADLRRPDEVLASDEVRSVLDLSRPVAVLAVAVLHAVADADDPVGVVARYRDRLVAGSYLAITHGVDAGTDNTDSMMEISRRTPTPVTFRSPARIGAFFDGFDLVEPGLVWAPVWHPDSPHEIPDQPELTANLAGVGRKP